MCFGGNIIISLFVITGLRIIAFIISGMLNFNTKNFGGGEI